MKKLIPTSLVFLLAIIMWIIPASGYSQTVINTPLFASFEDGSVNPFNLNVTDMNGSFAVVANPLTTGVNTTSKCLKYTSSAGGAWYGKLFMVTNASYTIQQNTTSHRYLHFFAYTTNATRTAEIQIKDALGAIVIKPQYTLSKANAWEEVSIDLGSGFSGTIGEIYIAPCLDWGGGLGAGDVYMVDQFTLSNSAGTLYNNPLIGSFETGATPLFSYSLDSMDGTVAEGANPSTTGINTTSNCLIYTANSSAQNWWGKIYINVKSTFIVQQNSTSHCYLRFYARTTSAGLRAELGIKDPAGNVICQPTYTLSQANVWEEVVIDLGTTLTGKNIGSIYIAPDLDGFHAGATYMVDEIRISNIPFNNAITTATTVADFETNGITPVITNEANVCQTLSVVDNPYTTGLNTSAKAIKATITAGMGDWWGGIKLTYANPVQINSNTKYMHVLVYTDTMTKLEFVDFNYNSVVGDIWPGSFDPATKNAWYDYVVDLSTNVGRTFSSMRACLRPNENPTSVIYLDQIVFNANPTPRTSITTKVENVPVNSKIYSEKSSIKMENVSGIVNIYNATGSLVRSIRTTGSYSIDNLNAGLYIVSVNGYKTKVIVK
jgi:hypothetical protein